METTQQMRIEYAGDKLFMDILEHHCPEVDVYKVVDFLVEHNLLSYRRCKAFIAFVKVRELVDQGRRITEAMHLVATQMVCSYETVRKYYYMYADRLSGRYQQTFLMSNKNNTSNTNDTAN